MKVYVIGSMRNPEVTQVAAVLRDAGYEAFDDWFSPGPEADERWQEYEHQRGRSYKEALNGEHAKTVFEFDKRHLDEADAAVLVMPAGRSAHMELGYMVGCGKPAYVLFDQEPDRFDIMYRFATDVLLSTDELLEALRGEEDSQPMLRLV